MVFPMQYILRSQQWQLLRQCLNVLLHGLKLPDTKARVGMSTEHLEQYLGYLNGLEEKVEIRVESSIANVMMKVTRETLRELTPAEFRAQTGHEFFEGQTLLAELEKLLEDRSVKAPDRF